MREIRGLEGLCLLIIGERGDNTYRGEMGTLLDPWLMQLICLRVIKGDPNSLTYSSPLVFIFYLYCFSEIVLLSDPSVLFFQNLLFSNGLLQLELDFYVDEWYLVTNELPSPHLKVDCI